MDELKYNKKDLLHQFETCLYDFWGEEPTKATIKEAWIDYLDCLSESENIPKSYYKLNKEERERLYKVAEV